MARLGSRAIVALSACLSTLFLSRLQGASRETLAQRLPSEVREYSISEKRTEDPGGRAGEHQTVVLIKRLSQADSVNALAFGPENDLLAVACGNNDKTRVAPGRIFLWRTSNCERVGELLGHEVMAESVAFSPDGTKLLSGGEARSVILWDVHRRSLLAQVSGFPKDEPIDRTKVEGNPGTGVTELVFSPDGRTLVSHADQDRVRFWDGRTYKERSSWIRAKDLSIAAIGFKPNGSLRIASVGRDGEFELALWDGSSPRPLWSHPLSSPGPVSLSPDGRYLAFGAGGAEPGDRFPAKLLLDASSGRVLQRLGSTGVASALTFSNDGRLLAIGSFIGARRERSLLSVWETASGARICEHEVGDMIKCLAFSPDGKTLAVGHIDRVVSLWSIKRSAREGTASGPSEPKP